MMNPPPPLSAAARALGYAGLLPQAFALALALAGRTGIGAALAMIYAAAIVSFLGGIWWGFAMRRSDRQGVLAAMSVVPSLAAVALLYGSWLTQSAAWPLIGLGVVAVLTLPVDRSLERDGEAPPGWFRFRATLSSLLAGSTVAVALVSFLRG